MKNFVVTLLLLLSTNLHAKSDWIELFKDGNKTYSLDRESLDLDLKKEIAKVWIKSAEKISKPKPKEVVERKTYFEVDCNSRMLNLISTISYDNKRKVINTFTPNMPKAMNVVPDTVGGNVFDSICLELIPSMQADPLYKAIDAAKEGFQCIDVATSNRALIKIGKVNRDTVLERCNNEINKTISANILYETKLNNGIELTSEKINDISRITFVEFDEYIEDILR